MISPAGYNAAFVWLLVVAALASIDALLAPGAHTLSVTRLTPPSVRLSESSHVTVMVTNRGSRTVRGVVRDGWPPSTGLATALHRLMLRAGEQARFVSSITPTRRGDRNAGAVTVRLDGPLRIAGRQASVSVPARVRVLPEFAARRHLPSRIARLRELDGRAAVQVRGPGSEFDSLREYVIGDDVRSIDWRATARRSEVVVRTWRPERDRHVFILVDTSRTSAVRIADQPRLDTFLESALLLSALTSHAGDRVQVVGFDRQVRTRVADSATRTMPALADRFAPIEPRLVEFDWSGAARTIRAGARQRSLVVILTSIDTGAAGAAMIRALAPVARDHTVVMASVTDPEVQDFIEDRGSVDKLYAAAAAERQRLEREAIIVRLRHSRIGVVTGLPDALPPALADEYLALKAAGKL